MTISNSEAALPRQPGSFGFAAGVFLASLLWLWLCGRVLDYVADDALILFRHVANHAAGLGMVWDRWHPVQAHSSVLWAYALRLLLGLGIGIEPAARMLGILAGAGCAATVAVLVRGAVGTGPALLLAAVAATFPPLALWSSAGLETAPAAALALLCMLAIERAGSGRWTGLAALLLFGSPFVRPDLPLQLLCGLALLAVTTPQARRLVWRLALAAVLGMAAYVALNHLRYGTSVALPVATKLRIEPRNVLRFARYGLVFAPQLALLWALLIPSLIRRRRRLRPLAIFAIGVALGALAELALLGGDELARGRFLCLPFLATLPALASVLGPRSGRRLWLLLCTALLALQVPWALHHEGDQPCSKWREAAGRWLNEHTQPTFTIAVAPAGFIPFYAERDTIDLMGLAHAQISRLPEPRGSEAWGRHATELAMAEGVCGVILAICDSPAEDPRRECANPTLRGIVAALATSPDYVFLRSSEGLGGGNALRLAVRRRCLSEGRIWGLVP